MVIGQDYVVIKDGQKIVKTVAYERVFLTHSTDDELDSREKKSGDQSVGKVTFPKEEKSKADVDRLEAEAINVFQKLYPNSDARLKLLEAAEYGLDLWKRGKIQAGERPGKPVDVDKATEKAAKILVQAGLETDMESAIAAIRARQAAKQNAA